MLDREESALAQTRALHLTAPSDTLSLAAAVAVAVPCRLVAWMDTLTKEALEGLLGILKQYGPNCCAVAKPHGMHVNDKMSVTLL